MADPQVPRGAQGYELPKVRASGAQNRAAAAEHLTAVQRRHERRKAAGVICKGPDGECKNPLRAHLWQLERLIP